MLDIKNLTKTYGDKRAVNDVSLHVSPGELYGFIGHNGAGKSTTIKAICGLLQFDSGDITVNGHSIKSEPLEVKKIISYLPDNPDLYEFMSGIKYLNFVADVYNIPVKQREELIHKYSDLFEITGDLAQPISTYSHGMKQKLALISALIHDPKLLIMDEPFVGLDPKAAKVMKDAMSDLKDRGGAIFFSTHVLEVAEKICDRVAIISHGKIVASGKMDEVLGNESLEDVFFELDEAARAESENG